MKLRLSVIALLLFAGFSTGRVSAQEEQTEDTHAHATSRNWKGFDVNTVLGNDEYANEGKEFFLYNVGTGRFIIEGGNWSMEGRLFHDDFGRPLYLMKDGYIKSGITEQTNSQKIMFGCNVPGVSKRNATWAQYNEFSFTVLMDVYKPDLAAWTFQRVETDPDADTYTYYMWETMPKNNPKNYYLGAAWGEWHVPEYKGDGYFIYLDSDRSCWTTAEVIGNTDKYEVNGDMIEIDELYQWRLISEEEFISVLNDVVSGLNPSVSSLVPDRDFCRNADNFDGNWLMEEKAGADYSTTGRQGYTFGTYLNKAAQNPWYPTEAWNKPVRLKNIFDKSRDDYNFGFKNSKFGFLTFEGIGRTYTQFVAPKMGWYKVQCYGFVQSDEGHDAFLFARVAGGNAEDGSYGGESKVNLVTVDPNTYTGKNVMENCLEVGKELTFNGSNYLNTLWICVTEDQFESGDISQITLQLGVGKDEATQSEGVDHNGRTYYYDTDWVCIDDIRVTYMGMGPVFFYEDEEDLEYLRYDPTNEKQYQSAAPYGQYGGATCLERTLKKNQWNSFSFPLPITGEQMRFAFGEDAQLAKIHSIGKMSQNPYVIDFKSVSLRTTDNVVEPGEFYLLKPTTDPISGIDPRGKECTYYELGRMFFSVNGTEPDTYEFPVMSLDTYSVTGDNISSFDGQNGGQATVSYIQTPGYDSFAVSDGTYTGTAAGEGLYAPNGSYVVSNNTIYHINKDTRLKGFRGWITLDNPIPQSSELSMAVYGMFYNDDEANGIAEGPAFAVEMPSDTAVYDLCGRKVGTLGMSLPKGLYIVMGKKFYVK